MKILYALQGTGNGHVTRASEIIPALEKRGEVDVLVSGTQAELALPKEPKYKLKGISFVFGTSGGINFWETIKINKSLHFLKEIKEVKVEDYDLIVNDFEPITAWAARSRKVPIIGLSHQSALLELNVPKPIKKDIIGLFILRIYAPIKYRFGFHFKVYGSNMFTPIIRAKVRLIKTVKKNHITVYLPAYSDKKIIKILKRFNSIQWHLFSKHTQTDYSKKNIKVFSLNDDKFVESMSKSKGVLCGAGFETPSEALFMRKKLMVVPMKNQYEQHYNAAALKEMGVSVLPAFKKKYSYLLHGWIKSHERVKVNYKDNTQKVIDELLLTYINHFAIDVQNEYQSYKGIHELIPFG